MAPESPEWPARCDEFAEICDVVKRVSVERAVMAAVSNSNILQMLGQFVDVVKAANIRNFLVVALDQRTADFCSARSTPHYIRKLRSRSGSTGSASAALAPGLPVAPRNQL